MSGPEHRVTGKIVPLRASARPARRPDAAEHPGATVLLFTGVRYERMPDPAPLACPPAGSDARKRG
ncbi:hypothetical protein M446_1119 [Methylobacterium sp. 4-46]|uniref:hypothetical protein n=1 Tax=unclassified Methylobacterium TaxID=2615210 RepID=UPI000165C7CA|nr:MULTISPECIES: hypothetical protein [Methylobacterium]ACA15647.1 hypothetical protein M446_1119 [Methylobacterium sp. 4-46]WFT81359.1 hypothetical protein QA634_05560 [Methylobacterium nodulans]